MKKKVLVAALLLLIGAGAVVMPRMVESSIPTAYYITPSLKTHENTISCTGVVQSGDVRQIYLQSVLVAEDVLVEVGDTVRQGDVLVRVDEEKTREAGAALTLARSVSGDLGVTGADLSALLASYGLPADAVDTALLDGLLADQGTASIGEASSVSAGESPGEIVSPIAGVVTAIDVEPGVPASPGKVIATIADNRDYRVLISIREEDVARVQAGDEVKVRGVGFSGVTYDGVVNRVYPTARKNIAGTVAETVVDAEVLLQNPDKRLKPGFTAKVEILGGSDYNLITVPYEAIKQDENNNEYVYLYEGGKLKKQVVVTGQEMVSEVEILEGVSRDSVVVYNPSDAIAEGAMIHIKGRAEFADNP